MSPLSEVLSLAGAGGSHIAITVRVLPGAPIGGGTGDAGAHPLVERTWQRGRHLRVARRGPARPLCFTAHTSAHTRAYVLTCTQICRITSDAPRDLSFRRLFAALKPRGRLLIIR